MIGAVDLEQPLSCLIQRRLQSLGLAALHRWLDLLLSGIGAALEHRDLTLQEFEHLLFAEDILELLLGGVTIHRHFELLELDRIFLDSTLIVGWHASDALDDLGPQRSHIVDHLPLG